jgi:Protein of unknown function (DUF3175)
VVSPRHQEQRCDDVAGVRFQKVAACHCAIVEAFRRKSHRRKSTPFRSAMSMLNFYINRAGKNLSASRRAKLDAVKEELRKAFRHAEAA